MSKKKYSFEPFEARMQDAGLPALAIRTFEHYYTLLAGGKTGMISENEIQPAADLPDADTFGEDLHERGQAVMHRAVSIKLNGGLGTSMGMTQAKSLLPVKDGLSFLEIAAQQAVQVKIPLILMNSFITRTDSLNALKRFPALRKSGLPLDFLQHKIPKVVQDDLSPARFSADSELEWCPPGHGDIYTALVTSGMLDKLLGAGYEFAFISNADNLGAVMDFAILGYFAQEKLPFMMEVADRTLADKKGGHLAKTLDGQLILREIAQCPKDDLPEFQDITRHRYFNTNNLWVNLKALKDVLDVNENVLKLPLIRNAKTVNPRDPNSTPVYQLETAMGAAIAVFPEAQALRVSRARFAPVKKTSDLLTIRSDAYMLTDDYRVVPNPESETTVVVDLDEEYYKLIDDLDERFPFGAPSMVACSSFRVRGDVLFERDVVLRENVDVTVVGDGQARIESGLILEGMIRLHE